MVGRPRYRARRGWGGTEPVPLYMVPPNDPWGALFAAISAVGRSGFRYRSELAPAYAALCLLLAGGWTHGHHRGWAVPLAAATLVLVVFLACPPYRVRVWSIRRARFGPRLDLRRERVYAAAVVGYGGGWLATATWWGPTHPPLGLLLAFGMAGLGVPWWTHRRRRSKSRVDRTMAAWPDIAESVGLPGSTALSWLTNPYGWMARIRLHRGQPVQAAINQLPAIESGLRTRPGGVRIEPDPNHADEFMLRVIESDPHAQPIPWAGTPHAASKDKTSITRPIEIGVWEDGQPVRLLLLRRNGLIGGTTGAGKSGLVNVIMAALVTCTDAVVWGIDLKGGMELGPWSGCLGRLATTPTEAVDLLADAVAELDRRATLLAELGRRTWDPTPAARALIIVADEYAELPEAAHPHADSLARRGRAVAVNLLAATQRPTQAAMGHGAVRSQMDLRICLRVRERRDVDLILGQGAHAAGWHAETLDTPGKFLLSTPEHTTPRRARAYLITDKDVTHTAARHATHQPLPTRTPARRATGNAAPAEPHSPAGPPATGETVPSDEVPAIANPKREVIDPERALWAALQHAPEYGLTMAELIEACGMSRTWVYYRIKEHQKAGRVVQTYRGRFRATPDASPDQTP